MSIKIHTVFFFNKVTIVTKTIYPFQDYISSKKDETLNSDIPALRKRKSLLTIRQSFCDYNTSWYRHQGKKLTLKYHACKSYLSLHKIRTDQAFIQSN